MQLYAGSSRSSDYRTPSLYTRVLGSGIHTPRKVLYGLAKSARSILSEGSMYSVGSGSAASFTSLMWPGMLELSVFWSPVTPWHVSKHHLSSLVDSVVGHPGNPWPHDLRCLSALVE